MNNLKTDKTLKEVRELFLAGKVQYFFVDDKGVAHYQEKVEPELKEIEKKPKLVSDKVSKKRAEAQPDKGDNE